MLKVNSCITSYDTHITCKLQYTIIDYEMFKQLQPAILAAKPDDIVIAQDICVSGKKVFYTGSVDEMHRMYDACEKKHHYEVILENRPTRLFLDVDSTTQICIEDIVSFLQVALQFQFGFEDLQPVDILDSCSDTKWSWHIVFPNIVMKNAYHVGAFVRRVVLAAQEHAWVQAIDTAVYTKNRMFRLKGSSKFGQDRSLKHEKPWHALLAQPSQWSSACLTCLEIDGSVPSSTSARPSELFHASTDGQWTRVQTGTVANTVQTTCPLLSPILDWLDRNEQAKTSRHRTSMTETGYYRVNTNCKTCHIANRTHKGNNIWFNIDVNNQIVYQRCYDEDCRRQRVEICVPDNLWTRWRNAWKGIVHAPKNENTLYNTSY